MARLPNNPDASPKDFASYTTRQWRDQDAFYMFWTERWTRVTSFIRSQHWKALQEVDEQKLPKWQRFPVVNHTMSVYSDFMTQWLQSRVRFSAVADSPDQRSISSADLADQVLKYLWDKLQLEHKRIDLAAWLLSTGNADLRVYWNTETGNMIPFAVPGPDGQPIAIDPSTGQPNPQMQPIMVDEGEIGIEVIPPQLVRWGNKPSAGVMVGSLLTYDEVYSRFDKETADQLSYSKPTGPLAPDLMVAFPHSIAGVTQHEEKTLLIEHYLPRSSRFPKGLWWTSASNDVVLTPPSPLPTREIPIIHFRWIPMPGHFTMGLSPLYDVTYSNKQYDEILARALEWINKVVPKTIRHNGDGLKYGEITEEPGQEIVVQPGTDPQFATPPAFPEQFSRLKQEISQDIDTVAGYKFRRPPQLPPGESTQRFRQPPRQLAEGEVVAMAIMNSKPAWQKLGYVLIDYVAKFYTEPRVISVVGPDRSYQWKEFQGSDLENLQATIHVDELPLYTWNRQSLRDSVIAVLGTPGANILFTGADGQLDKDRVQAALESVGIDIGADTLDPDVLEARNENNAFSSWNGQDPSQIPQVQSWQNDEQHLAEHSRVPKSLAFKGWQQPNQQAFLEHMSQHEQRIQQAAQQQQQQMLDQENSLRTIRATAETHQDVQTEFGKALVQALLQVLTAKEPPAKK